MRGLSLIALGAAVLLTPGPGGPLAVAQEPRSGGTLRVGAGSSEFTSGFDPTGEYHSVAWGLYSNMLLRTLVTYDHRGGPEGNRLVPDLAREIPSPSEDGLTWTFDLRQNIRFAPPINRRITSRDIEYAFRRIRCYYCVAQYSFYFDVIEGMRRSDKRGVPADVSGIETPDARTIVFHLKEPTGDFLHRLALPATAPIPVEVARCMTRAGEYGRYLIASGPYMISGSEGLDTSSCDAMRPLSGFDLRSHLSLVRNPNHDPTTDVSRDSYLDRLKVFFRWGPKSKIFDDIEAGRLDASFEEPSVHRARRYLSDPDLTDNIHTDPLDRTWYITMNLTQPPFDDIHVRKAVNRIIDKEALIDAWGGPLSGRMATHILPPTLTDGHPTSDEYAPYESDSREEAIATAHAEMALSRYDSDGDGRCDDPACQDVRLVNRNDPQWERMEPIVVEDLRELGIHADVVARTDGYTPIMTVDRGIPISTVPGWGKDYSDPWTFMDFLFHSDHILCEGNVNYSLVGATPEIARRCEAEGNFEDLPNVDADIDRCEGLMGGERRSCWVDLDRKLMEEVVPWVPYLWQDGTRIVSDRVSSYEWDQFSQEMAFSRMSVRR